MITYEQEWIPTERDQKMYDLAARYHKETEEYDRGVCTGPIVDGGIMPIGRYERAAVERNARRALAAVLQEAELAGISRADMFRAIGKHRGSL